MSVADSDDDSRRSKNASASKSASAAKNGHDAAQRGDADPDDAGSGSGEEGEEEEYEIEAILDARHGAFEEVRGASAVAPRAPLTLRRVRRRAARGASATWSSGRASAKNRTAGWTRTTQRR